MEELNRVLAGMLNDERQYLVDMWVTELRERVLHRPQRGARPFRERWDEGAEQVTLQAFAQEGVAPEVAELGR